MNTTMLDRLEYIIDDYLIDNDIAYQQEDHGISYDVKSTVRTRKNKVSVKYGETGYSVKMYPVGPDAVVIRKNLKEVTYFCSLLNGILKNGMKFYIKDGTIILEKFVDCIESRDRIPSSTKVSYGFSDIKGSYETYLDLILMVNHHILSPEQAFEEALKK